MITWLKKANNFQIAKVQPQGVASPFLDFFYQFQPGVAYKSAAYTKKWYAAYSKTWKTWKIMVR